VTHYQDENHRQHRADDEGDNGQKTVLNRVHQSA
jgi:hypothetical protein